MVSKRKRVLEDFDPNKSDPEDENFDPTEAGPPRKTNKKSSRSRSGRPGRRRKNGYGGSDIDDDEDEVSDSNEDDFFDEDDEEEDDEGAPVNAAGRRARKAATQHTTYFESSPEREAEESATDDSDNAGNDGVKPDEDGDNKEDDAEGEPVEEPIEEPIEEPVRPTRSRVVKLKLSNNAPAPRRATRAHTEEAEEFYELSNSGKHAVPSRDSRSRSPETFARSTRTTRGLKGLKNAPETIQEVTQESSFREVREADQPDELTQDPEEITKQEAVDQDMQDAADQDAPGEDAPVQTVEEDDDDDDVPITRRTRGSRANASAQPQEAESDAGPRKSRRLTRKSSKKSQEVSSDFEPGDESDDAEASDAEKPRRQDPDDVDSPVPRGRRSRPARSRRGGDSGDEEPDFDLDELNEEARELRQDSRSRRRRPRKESPIVYQENTRRARTRVNYYMPPLTSANIEEEEAEAPTAQPRARRGRGGASQGWERSLNTTFGPFGGGGGAGALLNGPWGTGAAGGVDSDSSDDEMVHRSSVAGNVGMTPTSAAAPGGLLPGAPGMNLDGAGAAPNVGKIKDRKALADADPLGVDLNVDFSKVGGLQGHIDQLKEMVQLPLLYPELFTRFHVTPPRGVLFHGPPGTGKTLLARALANSVGSGGRKISFYMRKGADALSKWVGEAEKQLRLLFEEARRTQPSIIFFDEIDGLAPVRSSKQEQIHASIVSTLLALMDGMDGRGQVIVIGATNRPDNIDPALRRPGRFDREFYFPLPDIEGRKSILNIHTADWGLSNQFKDSLAENTKGYGGADLRALCTEAALNAIQRTYPQIYASKEKLVVDPEKIGVHATDFMLSIKKLIPSSERSATSGAKPLPKSIEPLLRDQLAAAKSALDGLLPRKKKLTALEEAMYEQFDDDDHGFGREAMQQEFERSRVFRPRFIIYGQSGMGQSYLSSAILHYFEGVHVQNFDLPSILNDGRAMEQVIVSLFTEVRRHKPSVIYIPNIEAWYAALHNTLALTTFKTMLRSIAPTDPVLLLATAEGDRDELPSELIRDFFGFSMKNQMRINNPSKECRMEYFNTTLQYAKKKPREFPDPENRKKRVLEELPVAPPIEPAPPTKADMKAAQKRDHQLLNALKIQLQPIMDQINRKYKKFRQPVISPAQIEYLFVESEPNFVRPDIEVGQLRPYEIVKDKYDNDVLRDTASGKCYYNLETTTIEERLSNGFYARPKDFLFDIKALAKDAKNIGDKERTLKANELLSNVEVDVASIENQTSQVDWEGLYRRQLQRAKDAMEKERKRKAMQSLVDRVQSDLGGNDSDSQGPVTLGVVVPGSRTTARFQVRSPFSNDYGTSGQDLPLLSNGINNMIGEDTQMSGIDNDTQALSEMGPPPKSHEQLSVAHTGMTQISQRSVVTTLPPGVSPSAIINEASTTKTSDPSTHRSSDFSQMTNGGHGESRGGVDDDSQVDIPDTLIIGHNTSGDDSWLHSQAQAAAAGGAHMQVSNISDSPSSARTSLGFKAQSVGGVASILNDHISDEQSARNSGSSTSASQPLGLGEVEGMLNNITGATSGCTIEQLEQINRDLMDEIWRTRSEWNRSRVMDQVMTVFNRTMEEIEAFQGIEPPSQTRHY